MVNGGNGNPGGQTCHLLTSRSSSTLAMNPSPHWVSANELFLFLYYWYIEYLEVISYSQSVLHVRIHDSAMVGWVFGGTGDLSSL
jgi:hypothetical protein